jgi:electron transport complex protein RnfC
MGIFTKTGIRVMHNKKTSALRPVRIDTCQHVTLLMKQHIGAPCVPCVKAGERVLAGQLVGDNATGLCAPIHASISGVVKKIDVLRIPSGEDVQAVEIDSDGQMEYAPAQAPQPAAQEDFFAAVRASGLVGLGGAGFPTHAKLRSAAGQANILLVNAAECEPYITVDHREALDSAQDVLAGIEVICRWLEIPEAVIGIENNKKDAIAHLKALCAAHTSQTLKLRTGVLPSRYPQGAEKMFIRSLTGRVVPLGKLPAAVGVLPMNVGSVAFLGRYFKTGRPLISRSVTVDGGAIAHPMNVRAPVGIGLRELLEFCGAGEAQPAKIILGGPMMGGASPNLNAVLSKCNNAVLLFHTAQANLKPETACIRCGACVAACPMKLQPLKLEQAYLARDAAALQRLHNPACIECGCCAYVCPAGRGLVQRFRLGKQFIREQEAKA